jgi:hypothetical protein
VKGPWRGIAPIAVLAAVATVLYRRCLPAYFLSDDFGWIQLYWSLDARELPRLLWSDWSLGIWGRTLGELRPLVGLTFWIDARLWEAEPLGYHVTNLILYMAASLGLAALVNETLRGDEAAERMSMGTNAGLLAALLFIVHPTHVEAVAWISARGHILEAACSLWSLWLFARALRRPRARTWLAANVFFLIALLCYEKAVTVPAVLLVLAALSPRRPANVWSWLTLLVPPGAVVIGWSLLRRAAFGNVAIRATTFDNLISRAPEMAALMLGVDTAIWAPVALAAIVPASVIVGLRTGGTWGRALLFWGGFWPILQLLPMLATSYTSPRMLFLASAGPVAALAVAAVSPERRAMRVGALVAGALVSVLFAGRTLQEAARWAESGRLSRQMSVLLSEDHKPRDVLVLIAPTGLTTHFWGWAMPFAAEPPFVKVKAQIVEEPSMYCCPQWLERRHHTFKKIASERTTELYRIALNTERRQMEKVRVADPVPPREQGTVSYREAVDWLGRIAAAPPLP